MVHLDTRSIVPRLKTIESIAIIARVASTNLVAKRIVTECVENDLSLPQAIIIAGEQVAGRGRNERRWSSPAGKGIYATTVITRPASELPLIPLEMANIVASFLRETYAIDARIKWPNDILAGGRKIAGILIEARIHDGRAYLLVGTGVNVEPVSDDERPNATSIREISPRPFDGVESALEAFIEHVDERLSHPFVHDSVLSEWRRRTTHLPGDRIHCQLADRSIDGTWSGIDEQGRAVILTAAGPLAVSAGDLMI